MGFPPKQPSGGTGIPVSEKGAPGGVAELDGTANVPASQLGNVTHPGDAVDSVNSQTGAVVLDKTDIGLANVDNVQQIPLSEKGTNNGVATLDSGGDVPLAQLGNSPSAPVDSVNGQTGVVVLDKTDIGLGNVDNVQQIPLSEKGSNNGVATLDSGGDVPLGQLGNVPASASIFGSEPHYLESESESTNSTTSQLHDLKLCQQ